MSPQTDEGLPASGPNAEQIEYWNRVTGARWVQAADRVDAQIAHIGLAAMDRAAVAPGDRVLDVGCGCGHSVLQLAERVAPTGSVTGIDVSSVMLAEAEERAARARVSRVRFENADAQTHAFEPGSFDLLFSRFGVMFFADPQAAFANLRAALRPGGRLAFACWQAIDRNPWMLVPTLAAARHVQLPAPPAAGAPGPFSLADSDRVRSILEGAGFEQVALESFERRLRLAGGLGLEGAVDFAQQLGPAASALREADAEVREAAAAAIRDALAPFETPDGVELGAAAWLVTAVAPESGR